MIKGIIFDMDGVISDTQKIHSRVESKMLAEHGVILSEDEIDRKWAGVRTQELFYQMLKDSSEIDIEDMIEKKWDKMVDLVNNNPVNMIDGAGELIKMFCGMGLPIAVASSSTGRFVKSVLTRLSIADYFNEIISGDMVKNGKPDPEIFLLAASKLKVQPEDCLVIEDAVSGIVAALDAGMKCIGLIDKCDINNPNLKLIASLREISSDFINAL